MRTVTYRPRRDRGCLAVFAGLLFGGFGVLGFMAAREAFFLPFALLGGVAVAAGTAMLATRVTVDACGVRRSPRWPGGFRAAWADVEGWSVYDLPRGDLGPADSFTFRAVRLRLRGRPGAMVVTDSEAARPAFDQFVGQLREGVPDREESFRP